MKLHVQEVRQNKNHLNKWYTIINRIVRVGYILIKICCLIQQKRTVCPIVSILSYDCGQPRKWKMMYNLSRISVKNATSFTNMFRFCYHYYKLQHFYNLQILSDSSPNVQFRLKRDLFDETTTKATQCQYLEHSTI